jgi:hypothetical protein
VKQINVVSFQLKLPSFMKIHPMFHVSLLEPYHMFTIPRRIHDPPTHIEVDDEHEYEMEDILDSRIFNCQFEYLVHWHQYDVGGAHLGANKKPIKCYGEGSQVSLMISKQTQVCFLWNSLLKREVMS